MPSVGLWMVGASGIFFAASNAVGKLSIEMGASAFQVTAVRGTVMLSVVVAAKLVLRARGSHPLPVRHWLGVSCPQVRLLLARAACGSASVMLSFGSLQFLPIADANALCFLWPVFALIASACLLREGVRKVEAIGLVGAIAGSVCVARPSFLFGGALVTQPISPIGVVLALGAAVSSEPATLRTQYLPRKRPVSTDRRCAQIALGQRGSPSH